MISAVILTYNEENIIGECLKSLDFVDEIVVFDSYSTDKTLHIAQNYGAKIVQRKFDNYAAQRNEAFKSVSPNAKWILMVDADEIITPGLKLEVLSVIKQPDNDVTLYRVRRKDMFQGKWIKHSSGYPTWFGRLFVKDRVWVEREINEEYHTDGEVGLLKEHLIHYPFNKGLSWWVEKHNRYSSMEAFKFHTENDVKMEWKHLFASDPTFKRKLLKQIAFRLPFRPQVVFFYLYIIRMGFLDGKSGYLFCRLRSIYEFLIDIKIKEYKFSKYYKK